MPADAVADTASRPQTTTSSTPGRTKHRLNVTLLASMRAPPTMTILPDHSVVPGSSERLGLTNCATDDQRRRQKNDLGGPLPTVQYFSGAKNSSAMQSP